MRVEAAYMVGFWYIKFMRGASYVILVPLSQPASHLQQPSLPSVRLSALVGVSPSPSLKVR
jgi:hypothetical protein